MNIKKILLNSFIFTLIFVLISSQNIYALESPPNITAPYAITFDIDTNEIIYAKNIDTKTAPASITKLLTAILLAENTTKDTMLTYTKKSKLQEPTSYNYNYHAIKVGEKMSAKNAMDALLLRSCNDIAFMIADNIGNNTNLSSDTFINSSVNKNLYNKSFTALMNKKAKELKMNNSHFITPNGLDNNIDNHISTAYDIALLTKYAYETSWVKETMNKKQSKVRTVNTPFLTFKNSNKNLGKNGCVGGKTGYTSKAGRCLTSIYERNGRHLVGVILNSKRDFPKDRRVFEEMKKIIDWSYKAEKETYIKKNSIVNTASLSYNILPFINTNKTIEIPLEVKKDINLYNNDLNIEQSIDIKNVAPWNLNKNTPIGSITIKQRNYSKSYDLYPTLDKSDIILKSLKDYNEILMKFIYVLTP